MTEHGVACENCHGTGMVDGGGDCTSRCPDCDGTGITKDGFCKSLLKTGFCSEDIVLENGDVGHALCSIRLYSMEPPMRCPKCLTAPREWLCGNCGTVNIGGAIQCEGCHGLFTSMKDPDGEDARHRVRIHYTKQDNELREAGG